MKREFSAMNVALLILILAMAGYACSGKYLRTESAKPGEIAGVYTLILYGGNYANDIKSVAILAKEGTPYAFDVFAPEFEYRVIKNVASMEALEKAEKFVSFHRDFWKIEINEILDGRGEAIGYEVIPLYHPTVFGHPNIIRTYYRMAGNKVMVYIKPYFRYPALDIPFESGASFGPR